MTYVSTKARPDTRKNRVENHQAVGELRLNVIVALLRALLTM